MAKKKRRKKDATVGGDHYTMGNVGDGSAAAQGEGASASVNIRSIEEKLTKLETQTRVFISSTWLDLKPERKEIEKALHRMKSSTFVGMEYFGSQPNSAKEASLQNVDQSDIYVGIFGHRYGSGITEDEYRRATQRGLKCLIYIKEKNEPVLPSHIEKDPRKLDKLRSLKTELQANHVVSLRV